MKTDKRTIIIPDFMVALKALADFGEQSISDWHYNTRISYAHIHKFKNIFAKKGWIVVREEKIKHFLSLTIKGKELVNDIERVFKRLGITKETLHEYRNKTKHRKKDKAITEKEEDSLYKNAMYRLNKAKDKKQNDDISIEEEDRLYKHALEKIDASKITKSFEGIKLE